MPRYNYICDDCVKTAEKKLKRELDEEELGAFVFEVSHGFEPTAKELKLTKCPFCGSRKTKTTLIGSDITFRVRGGDWREFRKKNAAALQRDMALHQLQNDDPYGYMRPAGDKEELVDKLRKGGRKQTNRQYFT